MKTKKYKIKKNYNTGNLAVYEIHKGKHLWIKECKSKNKKDAEKEFLTFSENFKKEYLRLGGKPEEFPETKIIH